MSDSPNRRERKRIVYFNRRERLWLELERQRTKVKSTARAAARKVMKRVDLACCRLFLWFMGLWRSLKRFVRRLLRR